MVMPLDGGHLGPLGGTRGARCRPRGSSPRWTRQARLQAGEAPATPRCLHFSARLAAVGSSPTPSKASRDAPPLSCLSPVRRPSRLLAILTLVSARHRPAGVLTGSGTPSAGRDDAQASSESAVVECGEVPRPDVPRKPSVRRRRSLERALAIEERGRAPSDSLPRVTPSRRSRPRLRMPPPSREMSHLSIASALRSAQDLAVRELGVGNVEAVEPTARHQPDVGLQLQPRGRPRHLPNLKLLMPGARSPKINQLAPRSVPLAKHARRRESCDTPWSELLDSRGASGREPNASHCARNAHEILSGNPRDRRRCGDYSAALGRLRELRLAAYTTVRAPASASATVRIVQADARSAPPPSPSTSTAPPATPRRGDESAPSRRR